MRFLFNTSNGAYVYQDTNNFGDQIVYITKGDGNWIQLAQNPEGSWDSQKVLIEKAYKHFLPKD